MSTPTMGRFRTHVPPLDSPSKQLMLDLVRELEQVKIFDADLKKVHQYERKTYYENLDRIDREREAVHTAALDQAAAFHDRVREEAETTLKDHLLAEEEERIRKEEAIRKEQERVEQEKAEKARREREAAARVEAERQAKEQAEKKAQEEAAQKAAALETERKAAIEEKLRKEREQADAQKRRQNEEARKAQEEADQKAQSQQQQKLGAANLSAEEIRVQQRYVELHKTLKEMRKWLKEIGQSQPDLKATMGNLRRSIKKSVGQLRSGTGANKQQIVQLKAELEKALAYPEPTVDIRKFIAFPPEEIANSENKVPAMLIYGLNILAKSLISSLLAEASIKQSHAEPIGIIAAQIFSFDMFTYKGLHMSDIMWAKYRVVCPALWGFTGNDKTEGGRRALGWWRSADTGSWVSEQVHMDRMTALGAGYAAMTLRNFAKSPRRNPFPNTMFWASIHKILAIPPSELQETQIALLAALLRSSGERILGFFGQYGLAMMHYVVVDLPRKIGRETMAVTQLSTLKELYLKEKNFAL